MPQDENSARISTHPDGLNRDEIQHDPSLPSILQILPQDKLISVGSSTFAPQIVSFAKLGVLASHLKILPHSITISEGFTWVILHGGWTFIPKVNSDKFADFEQSPPQPSPDNPLNEELVDWVDDDDKDYLADDFVDDYTFFRRFKSYRRYSLCAFGLSTS